MSQASTIVATDTVCSLEHRAFATLGDLMFRRAESDGAPVMQLTLGDRQAAVPLRAFQREFEIGDETNDGRMIGLIVKALDFVNGIRPGDPLPREVLDGGATWSPEPQHRHTARARFRCALVAQFAAWGGPVMLAAMEEIDASPELQARLDQALEQAAPAIGVPGPANVVRLIDATVEELAYIEALRDRFLSRVARLVERLDQLLGGISGDLGRSEALGRVRRLAEIAHEQLAGRFTEVDAQMGGEVTPVLRNVDNSREFIRANRDWLYCGQRAWDAILRDWDGAATVLNDSVWTLVGRTYQFLAPRFMPMQEWQLAGRNRGKRGGKVEQSMTW